MSNGMDGAVKLIEKRIRSWERGKIFFPQDFALMESSDSIRQALSQLTDEGTIIRLARGVYCYPKMAGEYAMKVIYPEAETIAESIAAKENVRIIPYGDQAAYKLGLTSFRISDLTYLTDGSPRIINLAKGKKIRFNHTSEVKMFAFRNVTMQLMSSTIRSLWKGYLENDETKIRKMREIMHSVKENDFLSDINIPPAWVGEILAELWNE